MSISFPVPVLLQVIDYPKSDIFNNTDWYLATKIKDSYLIHVNYTTKTYIDYNTDIYPIEDFFIPKKQTKLKNFEEISAFYIVTVYSDLGLKEKNKQNMIININEN